MGATWHRARRARLLLTVCLAAVLLAGCGSSGVKPSSYVKSVCVALGNWKNTIQSAGVALESSGATSATRSVAKEDYQRFVAALVTATHRAAVALRSAGAPAVARGEQIASRLTEAFDRATSGLRKASSQAQAIRTDSASSFQQDANAVSAQIRSALGQIASVSPGQSEELRSAAAREPACQSLSG